MAETLLAVEPGVRLIVLSGEASSFVCPASLRSSLYAVVDKTRAYGTLSEEIAGLCRQHLADQGGVEPMVSGVAVDTPRQSLTRREEEIFQWIGRGLSNRDIAANLHLSQRTVETHRKNIVAKLGVSGADLVRLAALQLPAREAVATNAPSCDDQPDA